MSVSDKPRNPRATENDPLTIHASHADHVAAQTKWYVSVMIEQQLEQLAFEVATNAFDDATNAWLIHCAPSFWNLSGSYWASA